MRPAPTGAEREVFGVRFRNPVLLAAGTCGFGREVAAVLDLDAVGGFVTKSITLEPRWGNPAPRVAEFEGGMVNSVGLANPGALAARDEKLPWIRERLSAPPDLPGTRVLFSVAGHTVEEFVEVVRVLDPAEGFLGYELNLSCPNDDRRGGVPFALDPEVSARVVRKVREVTRRPLVAKLAPNDPTPRVTAARLVAAGVDGLTVTNTLPGSVVRPDGRPALGAGSGGISGPALFPIALAMVEEVAATVEVPVIGVGGITTPGEARAYLDAGARLVQIGTASFSDPRRAETIARALTR